MDGKNAKHRSFSGSGVVSFQGVATALRDASRPFWALGIFVAVMGLTAGELRMARQRPGVRWQRCEGKALASATPLSWGRNVRRAVRCSPEGCGCSEGLA